MSVLKYISVGKIKSILSKRRVQKYSKLGLDSHQRHDLNKALFYYLKTIESDSHFYEIFEQINFCLLHFKWRSLKPDPQLLEFGLKVLNTLLQEGGGHPMAHYTFGHLLTTMGNIPHAVDQFTVANQLRVQQLAKKSEFISPHVHSKRYPQFLIVGFMKCGTTSLYDYLASHPQILPAITKELQFYSCFRELGLEWYQSLFPKIESNIGFITGEATPIYVNYPAVASEIKRDFPEAKILIMVRNPVERTISSFYQTKHSGFEPTELELSISQSLDYIEKELEEGGVDALPFDLDKLNEFEDKIHIHILQSMYIYYIKKWMEVFPKEQVLILDVKDFQINTKEATHKVCNFLNLDMYQVENYPFLNARNYSTISPNLYNRLQKFFQPFNQDLEALLGRKFDW